MLPSGGLKEKLLAAMRGGLTTVLIPKDNEKDLDDIPENVKKDLTIVPVESIDDILKHALSRPLVPIEWSEEDPVDQVSGSPEEGSDASGVVTH